ncbi:MAG: aromatic aminobenezylarsenical efflux permease ArsG family transporter [Thermoguttaceae bacterium]
MKRAAAACLILLLSAVLVVSIVRALGPQSAVIVEPPGDGLIVYSFHSSTRCPTCRAIESQAHEAVESLCGPQLGRGEVVWKVLDYEQPSAAPLAAMFEIQVPVIVLASVEGGRIRDWKRLDQVWALVGDKPAFTAYVQDEIRAMLTGTVPILGQGREASARKWDCPPSLAVAYGLYVLAALYLGLLTSISPCPLATNIAAVSYVGRRVGSPRSVLGAGLLYTLGRCLLYVVLAVALAGTATAIPAVSRFLQKRADLVLGPVLVVLGVLLVGLVKLPIGGAVVTEGVQKRIGGMGVWGALVLGILFAVSFCPTSAFWFFSLVALTVGSEAGALTAALARVGVNLPEASLPGGTVLLPLVYGVGTAIPVLLVAVLLAYSARSVGRAYSVLARIEWWARQTTGWLFVLLGVWFSLRG